MKKSRLVPTIVALLLLAACYGCYNGGCRPSKKLDQRQSDYLIMSMVVESFNTSQSNWTLTITARTNHADINRSN